LQPFIAESANIIGDEDVVHQNVFLPILFLGNENSSTRYPCASLTIVNKPGK